MYKIRFFVFRAFPARLAFKVWKKCLYILYMVQNKTNKNKMKRRENLILISNQLKILDNKFLYKSYPAYFFATFPDSKSASVSECLLTIIEFLYKNIY